MELGQGIFTTIKAHVKTYKPRQTPGLTQRPVTRPDQCRWPGNPWPGTRFHLC